MEELFAVYIVDQGEYEKKSDKRTGMSVARRHKGGNLVSGETLPEYMSGQKNGP